MTEPDQTQGGMMPPDDSGPSLDDEGQGSSTGSGCNWFDWLVLIIFVIVVGGVLLAKCTNF